MRIVFALILASVTVAAGYDVAAPLPFGSVVPCTVQSVGTYADKDAKLTVRCNTNGDPVMEKSEAFTIEPQWWRWGRSKGNVVTTSASLLTVSDFHYAGSFRPPTGQDWTYQRGGGMAYDSATGTLYSTHYINGFNISEISIPALSTSTTEASLTPATLIQGPRPTLEGRDNEISADTSSDVKKRGVWVSGSKLILNAYLYFGPNEYSTFTRNKNLSTTTLDAHGPMALYALPSFPMGQMAEIPAEHQAKFGGKDMISGMFGMSIVSRGSWGPVMFAWNSADVLAGPTVRTGTAQAGSANTITFDSGASAVNDFYVNYIVLVTGGTGLGGRARVVASYNGATKVATMRDAWETVPVDTKPAAGSTFRATSMIPSTPLVYYTAAHPTLGTWGDRAIGNVWTGADFSSGLAFIAGTDTIAVFGQHSMIYGYGLGGLYGYGTGAVVDAMSSDPYARYAPNTLIAYGDLDAGSTCDGGSNNPPISGCNVQEERFYDPFAIGHGDHGYPYLPWVWLYDVNDLKKVYDGTINPLTGVAWKPWDVQPYAYGQLPTIYTSWPINDQPGFNGMAYDRAGKRIFLNTSSGGGTNAILHVLTHP